ncbi:MAG: hypothetical protein KTR15_14250 [Phycisphaeraceae bacterium]|nr:hypothetical protein [Phycisphaeraceae bacterium]
MPDLLNSQLAGVDWLIIAGYFAAIIVIGALASRGTSDETGFFLGGRRMPAWAVAMSFAATALSAATFIGGPEYAYNKDLTLLVYELGKVFGAVLVCALLLPPIYRAGCSTVYGYLGQRVSPGASTAASVAFLIGRVLASGARLFIAGTAFSYILYDTLDPSSLITAIVVFGAIGTLYTVMGGIKAVIWTDTLQLIVVVGALLVSMVLLLDAIPLPVGEVFDVLQADDKTKLVDTSLDLSRGDTLLAAIALTFFYAAAFGTDHDMAQRLLTCKSLRQSIGSLIGATLIALPITVLFLFTGLLLFVFYARPDVMGDAAPAMAVADGREVYPQYLLHELPIGLRGLAMAGLFAAAMSSLDSAINAMASSALSDVINPVRRRLNPQAQVDDAGNATASRGMVLVMGVVLTASAIAMSLMYNAEEDTLIPFALSVMTFAYAGLLGVFLCVILTGRGSTRSVIAALVAGMAVIAASRYLPVLIDWHYGLQGAKVWWPAFPYWMVYGAYVSLVVCWLGSPRK